jgi:Na+/H+-dicarboxylate symporter
MEVTTTPQLSERAAIGLSTLILLALGMGILVGAGLHQWAPASAPTIDAYLLDPLGRVFLRLVQFVVIPIVFSSLILGLTRIQDAAQVGRYTLKLMTSYGITSAIAVGLGMTICTLLQPGVGITKLALSDTLPSAQSLSLIDWLISLVPVNPFEAISTGNLLQTIFSAALVGVGIQLAAEKAASFVSLVESIYAISEKILSLILYTAPIGVFALMCSIIATQGFEVVAKLLFYVLGLLLTTLLMIGLYAIGLGLLQAKPIHFFQSLFPALSLAFGTASSNAALPVVLQNAQTNYGLRPEVASFAIPLGTALKRDGSAILQGFNALFIAQIYHVPLTAERVLAIALSSFLVSFSTPGVPGSAIITMTTVLAAAGLPIEGVAIVAGIDRLTDGFKTVINVIGNVANAVILSHWEPSETAKIE